MYFPYLRGKQYELLAVKEMADLLGPEQKVIPVIEPVRSPKGSGLDRCIEAVSKVGLRFVLIVNPTVGTLRGPGIPPALRDHVRSVDPDERWGLALIIDDNAEIRSLVSNYRAEFGDARPLSLIHKGYAQNLTALATLTEPVTRGFDIIHHDLRRGRFRSLLARSASVVLRDPFPAEARNSDYLSKVESMFTEDHLFYEEEDWFGFSDYVTIGEPFSEGGFTPRAVAIHWTYEPRPGDAIMIRHFTSERDADTIADVGGKFLQAARKLVAFLDSQSIHTRASEVMRTHLRDQTYPGLGIVKKLSIQNHLELVSGILSRS